jgi:hypothetical protein
MVHPHHLAEALVHRAARSGIGFRPGAQSERVGVARLLLREEVDVFGGRGSGCRPDQERRGSRRNSTNSPLSH